MTFGTLDHLRDIIGNVNVNTGAIDTRDDNVLLRIQATVYRALLARILFCEPGGPPLPFQIFTPKIPTNPDDFDVVMSEGFHRLLIVVDNLGAAIVGDETIAITGTVNGSLQTETITIDREGRFMSTLLFDSIAITGGTIVPSSELLTALGGTGTIEILENLPGELTDIENYWTAGLFMMEQAKELRKESEPPEMHAWITDAAKQFEAFLKRLCPDADDGQWRGQDNLLFRRGSSDIYGDQHTGTRRQFFP